MVRIWWKIDKCLWSTHTHNWWNVLFWFTQRTKIGNLIFDVNQIINWCYTFTNTPNFNQIKNDFTHKKKLFSLLVERKKIIFISFNRKLRANPINDTGRMKENTWMIRIGMKSCANANTCKHLHLFRTSKRYPWIIFIFFLLDISISFVLCKTINVTAHKYTPYTFVCTYNMRQQMMY